MPGPGVQKVRCWDRDGGGQEEVYGVVWLPRPMPGPHFENWDSL